MSLLNDAAGVESSRVLSRFRNDVYACLKARADALFELADALLCEPGPVRSPVDLSLSPEYRRGHGALYGGLSHGRTDVEQLFLRPAVSVL
ncbi:transposase [Nonomuraea aurantiaca]|uniref:transposase n=1 Tax=Nonomuraea aurantiaca TaxID=2878562 RepID=UPI001CD93152|nr:transposase [Nonomuraea aurantiaca]MCA2230012.1 transposase [Nonomuraea aurantiaca]